MEPLDPLSFVMQFLFLFITLSVTKRIVHALRSRLAALAVALHLLAAVEADGNALCPALFVVFTERTAPFVSLKHERAFPLLVKHSSGSLSGFFSSFRLEAATRDKR